jgi:hypothetical protein
MPNADLCLICCVREWPVRGGVFGGVGVGAAPCAMCGVLWLW